MEIVKIYNGGLVDARELQQRLQNKREFSHYIRQRIKELDLEKDKDYFTHDKIVGRAKRKEYLLTVEAAKELCLVERNKIGKKIRKYFIECEEKLKELKLNKRFEAFLKLETTKERLHQNVLYMGGTYENYIQIDLEGSKVFFNGEPISDEELSILPLKGRDLATEMTNERLRNRKYTMEEIKNINKEQHHTIRNAIIEGTGSKPEELPKEKHIKIDGHKK